jgi:hypothetical protein
VAGANINAMTSSGLTAQDVARSFFQTKVIAYLNKITMIQLPSTSHAAVVGTSIMPDSTVEGSNNNTGNLLQCMERGDLISGDALENRLPAADSFEISTHALLSNDCALHFLAPVERDVPVALKDDIVPEIKNIPTKKPQR